MIRNTARVTCGGREVRRHSVAWLTGPPPLLDTPCVHTCEAHADMTAERRGDIIEPTTPARSAAALPQGQACVVGQRRVPGYVDPLFEGVSRRREHPVDRGGRGGVPEGDGAP